MRLYFVVFLFRFVLLENIEQSRYVHVQFHYPDVLESSPLGVHLGSARYSYCSEQINSTGR